MNYNSSASDKLLNRLNFSSQVQELFSALDLLKNKI